MVTYPALGRAVALREFLQDALAGSDRSQLEGWLAWAQCSRLAPFRDLARTIKRHFDGVLAYMETRLTNGVMEAINGLLQLAMGVAAVVAPRRADFLAVNLRERVCLFLADGNLQASHITPGREQAKIGDNFHGNLEHGLTSP